MSEDYLPVRLSHLMRHCAVGAIVRGPNYLMTVKDIREWTDKSGKPAGQIIPYIDQVRSALGIEEELREPPIAKELDNGKIDGVCVPAVRFPMWMRCPSCGLLHYKPWKSLKTGEKPRCQNKDENQCKQRPELEQVQWVLVHADGHMADVPWHFITHGSPHSCKNDKWGLYLRLIDQGASNHRLVCNRCDSNNDFLNRINYGNTWRQPWLPETTDVGDDPAIVLEINDARVHSPMTCNALVIPPESRIRKGTVVDRLYSSSQKRRKIEQAPPNSFAEKSALQRIASEFQCSLSDIKSAWSEIKKGYPLYGKNITQGILLESEYLALIEEIPNVADDEDFVTEHHTTAWKHMTAELKTDQDPIRIVKSIEHLIAVNRLKEIMVFKGFKRLGGELVPPDISGESSWLPALELYGEGIFFSFSEEILARWEENPECQCRIDELLRRFAGHHSPQSCPGSEAVITPRFLLLHTFAHLLIRQLEIEAGYPAASLKERIYCTASTKIPMSGILVYVAVPDVVGSLGGLAELAVPERFLPLISGVFDHAEWCSLDPVCSEHEGQGPNLLNRAACHACALVPEPSCSYGNVLLDRTFIKGDKASGIPAFLDCVD